MFGLPKLMPKLMKQTEDRLYRAVLDNREKLDGLNRIWLKNLNLAKREDFDAMVSRFEGITLRARQVQFRISKILAKVEERLGAP
jgi:BMFP domain-containing protein YqiC